MDITSLSPVSTVLVVDFVAHGRGRSRIATQAIEAPISFGDEKKPSDHLIADATAGAATPQVVSKHRQHSAENSAKTKRLATLSFAAVAGFIAGALWKA